jgi:hypothetical protein
MTDLYIRLGNLIHITTLPHIRKAEKKYSWEEGVDTGESPQMLSHFFQIIKTRLNFLYCGAHSSKGGDFQTFASVKRVCILH